MADRRRRRRRASQDSEEEDESASGSETEAPSSVTTKARDRDPETVEVPSVRPVTKSDDESECESEDGGVGEAVLSDYDSADPEENGSHSEGGEEDEHEEDASQPAAAPEPPAVAVALEELEEGEIKEEELEEGEIIEGGEQGLEEGEIVEKEEAKTGDKNNLAGERQSGDGQESTDDPENKGGNQPGQKLDDDEDRKNPAYIPRKGLFFEHDVRGQTQEEERPKGRHRKLWKDEGRWEHDRFREEEQAPKSRDELIAYYGYDIRNGTGPSDMRQNRQRKPRHGSPPSRDKRYRDIPNDKPRYRDSTIMNEKPAPRSGYQGSRNSNNNGGGGGGGPQSYQGPPTSSGPPQSSSHPPPSAPRPSVPRSSNSQPPPNTSSTSSSSNRGFQGGRPQSGPYRAEGRGERDRDRDRERDRAPRQGPPDNMGPRSYQQQQHRPQHTEGERGPRLRGPRGPSGGGGEGGRGGGYHQSERRSPSVVVEDVRHLGDELDDDDDEGPAITMTTTFTSSSYSHYSKSGGGVSERDIAVAATALATAPSSSSSAPPASTQYSRQRHQQAQRHDTSPPAPHHQHQHHPATSAGSQQDYPASSSAGGVRDVSPPQERPVAERKSYSAARRTRARATDMMGKQASLEEQPPSAGMPHSSSAPPAVGGLSGGGSTGVVGMKGEQWQPQQPQQQGQGDGLQQQQQQQPLSGLDQDLARLSLAGQNWAAQSPPSYLRADLRGIPSSMHMGGAPYANMDDMGVAGGRAKRYSSQRQRPVPEPAPLHIGVMEGHYYEPMSYQGPIYTHGDSPAPLPPQGMLVQPEMHLPHPGHPGLHPHQSGAPMPNPALYAAPPVSMSPGQPPPQPLLAAPFYPPPGVMTFGNTNFPYTPGATLPPMYPNPQAQSQVYGGVTYYDTVQQQAQPKPSPPRRSSQPVTVKPPPPEDHRGGKQSEEVRS
ncbi:protein CASC3 [Engraulis encrasicolus]|uniref:protein CASC3 n=1 Tax=Engraulis encrasicolus TaxID=184585 RepID=UPI002FD6ED2B